MSKKILIEATHPEETRVAVIDDNRLIELDYESSLKKQVKGNIYLAKVTRVEPSLQAAFVEYGNDKQGFLPFAEIHPDYFRIPISDREALIADEAQQQAAENDPETSEPGEKSETDTVGGDDADVRPRRFIPRRRYKIQEVIKKHQIMLVQVTKEERGNKGAAMTTYLSLAGRYAVLMPNSQRAGGISRKISDGQDRRRLKEIITELGVPEGISLIVRTAGVGRTKIELKKDYEYLVRLWDTIRNDTLQATAPALIYEEGDLIKRTLRDMYMPDIEEILIEGDEAYKDAKNFVKMLMPTNAKRVQQYKDSHIPLFHRYHVEPQIDAILKPSVTLPSGGYLVMNQTEALVAIDVNSGRAIRERNIEETALKTNIEAADEIARQLRLRDMAGLIVVDFIDMEDRRNNNVVEKRLREALRSDRARIQVGRISNFGLLEMSRQRLRPSLIEFSSLPCPHCQATGKVAPVEAITLQVFRALQLAGIENRYAVIKLLVPGNVALYLFNQKRAALTDIEQRYHFKVIVEEENRGIEDGFRLEPMEELSAEQKEAYQHDSHQAFLEERLRLIAESKHGGRASGNSAGGRRRGRRGGRDERPQHQHNDAEASPQNLDESTSSENESLNETEGSDTPAREQDGERRYPRGRRRQRYRNGRNRGGRSENTESQHDPDTNQGDDDQPAPVEQPTADIAAPFVPIVENAPAEKPARSPRAAVKAQRQKAEAEAAIAETQMPEVPQAQKPKPRKVPAKASENVAVVTGSPEEPRKGWWSRLVN